VKPRRLLTAAVTLIAAPVFAQDYSSRIDAEAAKVAPAVTEIRHQLHQNPELSNCEVKTAGLVAEYLRKLGLEVHTNVAHTGVVRLLKGGKENEVPGFFYRRHLKPGTTSGGHHTPTYRADDSMIPVGVEAMSFLLLDYLSRHK